MPGPELGQVEKETCATAWLKSAEMDNQVTVNQTRCMTSTCPPRGVICKLGAIREVPDPMKGAVSAYKLVPELVALAAPAPTAPRAKKYAMVLMPAWTQPIVGAMPQDNCTHNGPQMLAAQAAVEALALIMLSYVDLAACTGLSPSAKPRPEGPLVPVHMTVGTAHVHPEH